MPSCFVVMGFGEKIDYRTQRTLDLDKSYKGIIKPAVEACGLECIRADDIIHAGVIDKPMYENLLDADLVIADLSTANPNAIYELGVRHALRPNTTIIIAEDQFKFPFDLAGVLIRTYEHLGKGIDFEEVEKLKANLIAAIQTLLGNTAEIDSPVYTFIPDLNKPGRSNKAEVKSNKAEVMARSSVMVSDEGGDSSESESNPAFGTLLEQAQKLREAEDFHAARALFSSLHGLNPSDPYVVQQLALATYKAKQPDAAAQLQALKEARALIEQKLAPRTTNDPETLGLWGAIHKRLWELGGDAKDLDRSVWAYERGYYLKRDYYNGINYAFMLNVRAREQSENDEATADRVLARRIRKELLSLVDEAENKLPRGPDGNPENAAEAYWIAATRLEALLGLGETSRLAAEKITLFANAPEPWMPETTQNQLDKLSELL